MSVVVVYHRKCMDGLWAAACVAVHERMQHGTGLDAHSMFIHGMQYGDAVLPALDNAVRNASRLYIVDFSLPPEVLLAWCAARPTLPIHWIDHHRTSIDKYKKVTLPANVTATLDEGHSGAKLVAMHYLNEVPAPVAYVSDRDLWQWRLPDSHVVNLGLGTWMDALKGSAPEHEHVLALARTIIGVPSWDAMIERWAESGHSQQALLNRLTGRVYQVETPVSALYSLMPEWAWVAALHERLPYGRVLWVNSSVLQSEIGSQYSDASTVVCVYSVGLQDRRVIMSWRSQGGEAIHIAQALGGGGHPNAAGAAMPLDAFFAIPFHQIGVVQ